MDQQKTYELTLSNLLRNSVERNPEQIISYRGELNFTYAQFLDRVLRLARSLVKLGDRKSVV